VAITPVRVGETRQEVESMKKIEAIIDPSKMEEVKNALTKIGIRRMTISKVEEFGTQETHKEFYRAKEYVIDVIKEFKIELMVPTDEMVSRVIEVIEEKGTISDEEIFVSPLEEVTRFMKKGGRDEKNRSHCQTV
jgi:nitrogen regulatory protein P-II 1